MLVLYFFWLALISHHHETHIEAVMKCSSFRFLKCVFTHILLTMFQLKTLYSTLACNDALSSAVNNKSLRLIMGLIFPYTCAHCNLQFISQSNGIFDRKCWQLSHFLMNCSNVTVNSKCVLFGYKYKATETRSFYHLEFHIMVHFLLFWLWLSGHAHNDFPAG